ncbi:MAG: HIRAN domain-containing protein [Clostridiales bacterium]|nr:HIRAN domain-containing protein [Clostridiales bacterium]MCD8104707.1 HIRAN domain-containing protein [Lachnospiraceae bacterium]
MKEKYITVTGMKYYYGLVPFKIGKKLKCVKEPENPYDSEAIKVTMKHIGTVGHVANAPYTTVAGTMSAGRIYEKVGKKFKAEVMFITPSAVICKVLQSEENHGGQKGEQECINEESPA